MSDRMCCWALGFIVLGTPACQKNGSSSRSAPAPALNPDAPPATSDVVTKPVPGDGQQPGPTPAPTLPPRYYAYIGGGSGQIGIYKFEVPAGNLLPLKNVPLAGAVTSYMAFHPTSPWLYVTNESGTGAVMAFSINPDNGELTKLNEISVNGGGPTHVSVDLTGKYVMTANYGTGEINSFAIQPDGRLGPALASTIAGQNAHQILSAPSGTAVYVPCLGSNYVAQYTLNTQTGQLTALTPPNLNLLTGGPRHMAFHPKNPWAYVLKELNSTIQAVSLEAPTQQLKLLGTALSTRPVAGGNNTGAEVQVHPLGSFVYTSNRGDNTIALFTVNPDGTLTYKSVTPTGGTVPRHFSIIPNGKWLLAANQDSGTVTVLELNPETGALTARGQPTSFPVAQFVEVIDLNRYKTTRLR
ncbi:MAG TPA: lactonase family protein [Oligoflexus sp.]|uniref:lactonase family protein n=1 Tax=Oligoflexus sp. TaxID=1971216 RepID=UPI002D646CB1|nr:lactonase family protein [Oligoflexus sp.]HYX35686.1 lactonase family protein [Oligoflexus sp.]